MAKTIGIFGMSGDGKSTSICINPDGTYNPTDYHGMNPETTVIFNCDRKSLPFKSTDWTEGKNLFSISDETKIKELIKGISSAPSAKIKTIIIDTINGIMVDKEMFESRKMTYDKWMDLAKGIYELIDIANNLRNDLTIYFLGHVSLFTDVDGNESKCLVTNGKKLEKIRLESKLPIVLFTNVDKGTNGDNKHYFETKKNRSTAKTPLGMFEEFLIPNSLKLVDDKIRAYYGI